MLKKKGIKSKAVLCAIVISLCFGSSAYAQEIQSGVVETSEIVGNIYESESNDSY